MRGPGIVPEETTCPKCGGRMWDNRLTKRNPRAPDFKCRSRLCDGVIWPPRASVAPAPLESYPESPVKSDDEIWAGAQKAIADDEEELPFR